MSAACLGQDVGAGTPAAAARGLRGAKRKEEERGCGAGWGRRGVCAPEEEVVVVEEEEERDEGSSIGVESEEEEGESGERRRKVGGLGCLDGLEDALPIKRGLSSYFSGKSKSFADLLELAGGSARDLAKPESPFNKRRRILASSNIRTASFASLPALTPFRSPEHHRRHMIATAPSGSKDPMN